jgi:hypothetical protein
MSMTRSQKEWLVRGGIGTAALGLGYLIFHRRPEPHLALARERALEGRGEYGKKHRHHHKEHGRGEH